MCQTRREFLTVGGRCIGHMALMWAAAPISARRLWASRAHGRVRAQEAWGRLEQVAEGVWALISTPLQDRTTLCNGGIVAGRAGVLVVESFASERGAGWMAEQARALTGRWPTHVVVTHYHGDHSGGLAGFGGTDRAPQLRLTSATRELLVGGSSGQGGPSAERSRALADAVLLDGSAATALDLGDRRVQVLPRGGHTTSDVTVELDDPSIVFCGDLVWNEMFPNYVDATPSRLSQSVRALRRDAPTVYVPGHGPLADAAALDVYLDVLDHVEAAARAAVGEGVSAADAARTFSLPESVGEWFMFNPAYYERALSAWERELAGA